MAERSDMAEFDEGGPLVSCVPDALLVVDADSGEIRAVNDRAVELLECGSDDLVGQQYTVVHPSGETDDYAALYARRLDDSERELLQEFPDGSVLTVETADGAEIPVEVHCRRVEDGGERLVVGLVRDVTDQRDDQRQVRLIQEATDQLLGADTREQVAWRVANAVDELFGYTTVVVRLNDGDGHLQPAVVVGGADTSLGERPVYPTDGDNPAARAYREGTPLRYDEVSAVDDDHDRGEAAAAMYVPIEGYGVVSILDPTAAALDDADVELVASLAASARTILDRIDHEAELERQNERLDEFANLVSHDLQNPLAVAESHLSLAAAKGDGDSDHLDTVGDALDRMGEIVEDTLTLARQGETVDDPETVPVWELATTCWQMVESRTCHLDVVDTFSLRGDRERLSHLFENLFRNAVEHGRPNDCRDDSLTVSVGLLDDGSGFYVADDGTGLADDLDEEIFEAGRSTAAAGTGFGLSIVRQVAQAHGWSVRIGENCADGARFEFVGVDCVDAPERSAGG